MENKAMKLIYCLVSLFMVRQTYLGIQQGLGILFELFMLCIGCFLISFFKCVDIYSKRSG